MNILVINAGSSSLKYQLLNPDTQEVLAKGLCERIGIDGKFTYKPAGKDPIKDADVAMPTHSEAIQTVLHALVDEKNGVISSMKEIDAVGHRVVHGGEKFAQSVLITDEVMAAIEECNPLAPLHNPANIIGIKACQELMPGTPMVAVFDTAFHQTMPPVAYTYALPYEYYEQDKVRRYGFHGTSHKYVSQRAAAMLGKPIEELKLISCHLGNGSSITAIDGTQFTRKRVGSDVLSFLVKPCGHCKSVGYVPEDIFVITRIRADILDCFAGGYHAAIIELNENIMRRILNEGLLRGEVETIWREKRVYMIPHKTFQEAQYSVRGDNSGVLNLPDKAQLLY